MYVLKVENENPFDAGWHACHFGLPKDCIQFDSDGAQQSFNEGFQMRQDIADMEDANNASGHGHAHIAFLVQATNEFPNIKFVRSKVSMEKL